MKITVRIDVEPDVEEKGLDICQMGEHAYDDELLDLTPEALSVKLCEAAHEGNLVRVHELIKSGVDPIYGDYDGRTAYHLAAAEGRLEIFEYLYDKKPISLDFKDKFGNTPLSEAFNHMQSRIVEFLISKGAKLIARDYINDFFECCAKGDIKVLDRFLAAKMDVNVIDYDMRTALHIAASDGQIECVKILLENGGDKDAVDRWGFTPSDCAKIEGYSEIMILI